MPTKLSAERVRRVIKGVSRAKDTTLKKGLGGSFNYCTIGEEINEENLLKGKTLPSYESLARYVFYTATGQTVNGEIGQNKDFFVAKAKENVAFFLIYKSDINFLRSNDSALNFDRKEKIQKLMKQKRCSKAIVFAPACFCPIKELVLENIIFCQLPFAIHRIIGN